MEGLPPQAGGRKLRETRPVEWAGLLLERAENVVEGKKVFGDVLYDQLEESIVALERLGGADELVARARATRAELPAAEIANTLAKAEEAFSSSNLPLAASWFAQADTTLEGYEEGGLLTRDEARKLTERLLALRQDLSRRR